MAPLNARKIGVRLVIRFTDGETGVKTTGMEVRNNFVENRLIAIVTDAMATMVSTLAGTVGNNVVMITARMMRNPTLGRTT